MFSRLDRIEQLFPVHFARTILVYVTSTESLVILISETDRDYRFEIFRVIVGSVKLRAFDLRFLDIRILWS